MPLRSLHVSAYLTSAVLTLFLMCRLEGPVFALVNPFRAGNLRFDDKSFIKYLEVRTNSVCINLHMHAPWCRT